MQISKAISIVRGRDVALLAVVPTHGDNIDGASVGIEILKVAPGCSVPLFSGQPEAMTYTARAAEKGYHFELLTKPIPPRVLLSKVKEITELPSNLCPSCCR